MDRQVTNEELALSSRALASGLLRAERALTTQHAPDELEITLGHRTGARPRAQTSRPTRSYHPTPEPNPRPRDGPIPAIVPEPTALNR